MTLLVQPAEPVVMSVGELTAWLALTLLVGAWVGMFFHAFLMHARQNRGDDE